MSNIQIVISKSSSTGIYLEHLQHVLYWIRIHATICQFLI